MLRPTMALRLRRGLVGYWPLDEASGNAKCALYGPSGPFDLTDTNTVTTAAGPSSNLPAARLFTAANTERLAGVDSPYLEMANGSFTFSCWAYLTTKTGTTQQMLISKYLGTGNQREWALQYLESSDRLLLSISADGTNVASTNGANAGAPTIETWYHLIGGWDKERGRSFLIQSPASGVFGTADEATVSGVFAGTAVFTLGALSGGGAHLNGRLAHVGLWRRVLSTPEIFWLYNYGQGRDLTRGC